MDAASRLSCEVTATADAATTLRRRLGAWLEDRELTFISVDVVMAAYEAMANSVEHAYVGASSIGLFTLAAIHEGSTLTVTISDAGIWREHDSLPHRGQGLRLADAVSDTLDVDHHGETGTCVTLTWDVTKTRPKFL